ncbi:MAG TPA: helix-turn-helix domain-containing protein [Erysipelothrix sp.]
MILADKILMLRKKAGFSQEELANRLNVSRQSISKWEQAQSIPEMDKLLKLSELFEVSLDYLLRDDQEDVEYIEAIPNEKQHKVTLETAHTYLEVIQNQAPKVALAVAGFIVSPIALIILAVFAENNQILLTESMSSGIGLLIMFLIVALCVAILVHHSSKVKAYEFLENSIFETEYGVEGLVNQKQKQYESKHTQSLIIGVLLCILSVIPIFIALMISSEETINAIAVSCVLMMVSIGVFFLVRTHMINDSFNKLKQVGEYAPKKKRNKKWQDTVAAVYWLLVVAGYLAYSFITNDWGRSWIIYPVAGVLFGAIASIMSIFEK